MRIVVKPTASVPIARRYENVERQQSTSYKMV